MASPTLRDRFEAGNQDLSDDDLLDLEDDLPASVLDQYREARMAEYAAVEKQRRRFGGGIQEISRQDYTRDVTEASKSELPEFEESGNKGKGTGVICFLYNDSRVSSFSSCLHFADLLLQNTRIQAHAQTPRSPVLHLSLL